MILLEDGRKIVQILKQLNYNQATALSGSMLSQLFFQSKVIDQPPIQLMSQFDEFLRKKILVRSDGKIYSTIRIVPFNEFYFIVDSPMVASTGGLEKYFSRIIKSKIL